VRDYLQPGTSALFMVIEQATPDKAIAALQQYGGTVIKTSLSDEDTKKLQEALQPPERAGSPSQRFPVQAQLPVSWGRERTTGTDPESPKRAGSHVMRSPAASRRVGRGAGRRSRSSQH
jgi:Protein of unknown function (DUF1269)